MEVRNRFKGLDLIVCLMNYGWRFMTLYRRQRSRQSPWERIAKKTKWLSGEALQIAVKTREVKSKGEKERYKNLNAEFQRIARRDKKGFLSDQCKEIEENNRMGKTRDLYGRRQWHPTPVLLLGKSHGRRSLAGCSPTSLGSLRVRYD